MRQLQKYRNNLNTPSQPRLPVKAPSLRSIGTVYCHTNSSVVGLYTQNTLDYKGFQSLPEAVPDVFDATGGAEFLQRRDAA